MNTRLLRILAVVAALAVFLVSLVVSRCDSARREAESGPTKRPASDGLQESTSVAGPGSAGTGEDRVRITFRPAGLTSSVSPKVAHGVRPPYPWLLPEPVRRTLEALKKPMNLDYTDATLDEILDHIAESLGVTITDLAGDERDKRITFQMRELEGRHVLALLLRQYGLAYGVDENGTILVGKEDQASASEAVRVSGDLDLARSREQSDHAWAAAAVEQNHQVEEALRGARLEIAGDERTAMEWIVFLQEASKINLVMQGDSGAHDNQAKFALPTGAWSAEEVLREIASRAGMEQLVTNGLVYLGDPEEVEQKRHEQDEKLGRIHDQTGRPVTFLEKTVPAWRLVDILHEQTRLPVIVDEAVWNREEPLAVPTDGLPLGEAMDRVAAGNGLSWRLFNGTVYVYRP